MSIQLIESAISVITLVLAYFVVVTVAGSFRAWVAFSFGDDTAESLGLMSLNPLVHVDFLGMIFLLGFGFGWGRHIPVNPFRIQGPSRILKIVFAYLSDAFAHLLMAVIFFSSLIYAFGLRVLELVVPMIYYGQLVQSAFAQAYPDYSSLAISLGLIGVALIFLNVLLAVLNFIVSIFGLFSFTWFEQSPTYSRYRAILMIVIPMVFILLFIHPLRKLAIKFLIHLGLLFASMFNVS